MAHQGRGGYQQPQRPAAVSGPGALSQRTDGGAGNPRQPIRAPAGGQYGERKALEDQQRATPLPDNGGLGGGGGGVGPDGVGVANPVQGGVFGPTQRPNEANNAGQGGAQANPLASNPQAVLRVMYAQFPHPSIARLIDWSATGDPTAR